MSSQSRAGHVAFDNGGEGFAQVTAANARQVHDGLVALGISPEDIEHFNEVLSDPDTIIGTPVLVTAWGQPRVLVDLGDAAATVVAWSACEFGPVRHPEIT